jgi:Lrp/AsnC family leucine-responsive transcriptional regulator
VAERVRKLQDAGIIAGFHASIQPGAAGLPLLAFIQLDLPAEHYSRVISTAREASQVLECHHVSGGSSFVLKVVAASMSHLEALIAKFSPYGRTSTAIVLSSPVIKRVRL